MYKLCKTEQSAERQREIEQTLLQLMLTKHYDEIKVSEICEAANIPRKSFYRYFDGKEGVKQALLHHTMTDFTKFQDMRKTRGTQTLHEEFEELFAFWKSKKVVLDAFDKSGLIGLLIECATSYAMEEFWGIERYLADSSVREKEMAYQFVISGMLAMTINWYRSGFVESVPNIARTATRVITKPLFENLTRKD